MLGQDNDFNLDNDALPPLKEESNNRTFIIAAGILAGVVFLSIACMAAYALIILPRQKAATAAQEATIQAQNLQVAQAMTQTAAASAAQEATIQAQTAQVAQAMTQTANVPARTPTAILSPTPVLAVLNSPTAIIDPLVATNAAIQTQTAQALKTPTVTATAAMPQTGFADEVGLPGLVILAVALVAVILLARRLRASPAK
ncbi:MAG: hypothetical protein KKC71_03735 [Chloroflexi bacterium]|nr:hypothetical protein [Chloroflexota bacterium]